MKKRWHNFWKQWQSSEHTPEDWAHFFHDFMGTPPHKHWMFRGRRFKPWRTGEIQFNPFLAMLLSKGGGFLALYILHLLKKVPQYGNELMQRIEERTGGQWFANPGAVYPLLTLLEESGFIEGEWEDPDKRTIRRYHLTPAGKEELDRLKAVMRPKLVEAIDVLREMVDDLDEE